MYGWLWIWQRFIILRWLWVVDSIANVDRCVVVADLCEMFLSSFGLYVQSLVASRTLAFQLDDSASELIQFPEEPDQPLNSCNLFTLVCQLLF